MDILFGESLSKEIIEKIILLDKEVYSPKYAGEFKNMYDRWLVCKDSFVVIMENNDVVGYINYFPICEKLFDEIAYTGNKTRDDDILPHELSNYCDNNHIFILSIVIKKEYRDGYTVKLLCNTFKEHLNDLDKNGKKISDISVICISEDGEKCVKKMGLNLLRMLSDNNMVYITGR